MEIFGREDRRTGSLLYTVLVNISMQHLTELWVSYSARASFARNDRRTIRSARDADLHIAFGLGKIFSRARRNDNTVKNAIDVQMSLRYEKKNKISNNDVKHFYSLTKFKEALSPRFCVHFDGLTGAVCLLDDYVWRAPQYHHRSQNRE